jgi:hypothetical protein
MTKQIGTFFKHLLGPTVKGHVCIATMEPAGDNFKERFFAYPNQLDNMLDHIDKYTPTHHVYFCPQLLRSAKRTKDNVTACTAAWADLDECDPSNLLVKPTITIESSPLRYQAYWMFEDVQHPESAQEISKRIAYYHSFQGADRSGWDLTQLLRVPGTFNKKPEYGEAVVKIEQINRNKYRPEDFKKYPAVTDEIDVGEFPYPGDVLIDKSGEECLIKHEDELPPHARFLFENEPDKDAPEGWSGSLWKLQMILFEADLTREDVFLIARDAACNKYRRENKPMTYLWIDVCRAWTRHQENRKLLAVDNPTDKPIHLLTKEETAAVKNVRTFIEDYIDWAGSLGDAAEQYHQAGALVILSSLLSGSVRLPTSFGTVKPNLWFMILADTTLTRKSTAMDIAMDLLEEVDPSVILATDGSIEGLMTSLSTRPGQPSIFLRDEFSGLLEAITKKDYYAGMAETLTKLYDGKLQKRVLKKEVIEVKDPTLILFAGGIKNKVCGLLTTEHVSSGFVPRFVFITAESDVDRVKPLGPPTLRDTTGRDKILATMRGLREFYFSEPRLYKNDEGRLVYEQPQPYEAELAPETWARYNDLERRMMQIALKSSQAEILTPTYDRLSKSALKTAVLIAASRNRSANHCVVVELIDLLVAIKYMEGWRAYTNEIINNVGLTHGENEFAKILRAIVREPGVARSKLMQRYHLTARNADYIFATLEQRGQIDRQKQGGTERLFPFGNRKKYDKVK